MNRKALTTWSMVTAAVALIGTLLPSFADAQTSGARACTPLETREPNAAGQRPAFPEQTRACADPSGVAFDVVVMAKGLESPGRWNPCPAATCS